MKRRGGSDKYIGKFWDQADHDEHMGILKKERRCWNRNVLEVGRNEIDVKVQISSH